MMVGAILKTISMSCSMNTTVIFCWSQSSRTFSIGRQHRFMHSKRGKYARHLKGAADAMTHDLGWRTARQIDTIEQNATVVGRKRARDQVEERAFSCAVGADHGGERTARKTQRNIVRGLDAAK